MTVTFVCGHRQFVTETETTAPVCALCGDRRIRAVIAPAPRFHSVDCEITGPCVVITKG